LREDFNENVSLKEAAKMGKEKVKMDGELAQIKANTDDSISKLAESQEPSTVMQVRDITGW